MLRKVHNRLCDKPAYIDAVTNIGGTIDDRKFLVRSPSFLTTVCRDSFAASQLESILTLMARLGTNSEFSSRLQQVVINIREHIPRI